MIEFTKKMYKCSRCGFSSEDKVEVERCENTHEDIDMTVKDFYLTSKAKYPKMIFLETKNGKHTLVYELCDVKDNK